MSTPTFFIGLDVDIAARRFAASIGTTPWKLLAGPATFADSLKGFQELLTWLETHRCTPDTAVLCMEATGFSGEPLAYFLAAEGYRVAAEPLIKVRRTFPPQGRKRYEPDSQHIAEYACRLLDELRWWQPRAETLERVRSLVTTCEQDTQERTGLSRAAHLPLSKQGGKRGLQHLEARIQAADQEIRDVINPRSAALDDWPCF